MSDMGVDVTLTTDEDSILWETHAMEPESEATQLAALFQGAI